MSYVILIIIGLILGNANYSSAGPIFGGLIGFVMAWVMAQNKKINDLQQRLNAIQRNSSEQKNRDAQDGSIKPQIIDNEDQQQISHNYINDEVKNLFKEEPDDSIASQAAIVDKSSTTQKIKKEKVEIIKIDDKPSVMEGVLSKIKSLALGYFTGGNFLVRTGMLVLFVGIAFLLKYVAERTVIAIEYRYFGIVLASLVMLFLGWKLRHNRRGYALSLQGGGIGLLYLTLFAAMRIHQLIPAQTVLILLVFIVVLTAVLAIVQDSLAFAVIGMVGGFAAPILTSTGNGSHVHLFAYYLLLNLGVFAIAWFKSWRILNVVGFIATFGVGTIWGFNYYKPEFFNSVEPFLISYFLMYTFIAVLFALKQAPKLKGINDSTLVFGTPLVAFSLQAALLQESEYGLAYSAIVLALFYGFMVLVINFMHKPYMRHIQESFVALAVGFATLAIPLAFDGRVTSAMWVAEAAAMAWIGIRQSRILPRFSGYLLVVLGTVAFFIDYSNSSNQLPWINADFIGILIIVVASGFVALYARVNKDILFQIEVPYIANILVVLSLFMWLFGGIQEIDGYYHSSRFVLFELFFAVAIFSLCYFSQRLDYSLLKLLSVVVAGFMIIATIDVPVGNQDVWALFNNRFIGLLILTISYYVLSWFLKKFNESKIGWQTVASNLILILAVLLLLFTVSLEIQTYVSEVYKLNTFIGVMIFVFIIHVFVANKIKWKSLKYSQYLFLPFLIVMVFVSLDYQHNFHANYGAVIWLMSFVAHFWLLKSYQDNWKVNINAFHVMGVLLYSFIIVFETGELVSYLFNDGSIWHIGSYSFAMLAICLGFYFAKGISNWPIGRFQKAYMQMALPLLMIVLIIMIIGLNLIPSGLVSLIPYMPFINLIDFTSIASLVLIWKWHKYHAGVYSIESNKFVQIIIALTAFLILNAILLRCFHFWYGMEYRLNPMLSSFMVQTGLSILWTITAVSLMILSTKNKWRQEWMIGMGLIIVVVIKLFLVDMSASGTIERIVTFLTVGVLLSLVGYFSPLPPEIEEDTDEKL